jgi:hypothetical protein
VAVSFGGRSASYRVGSDSVVVATTPATGAPRSVDIRIRLADGSTVVLARAFSYLPRPRVDGVTPAMGGTSGGTWVTLRGVALRRTTQVLFGTVAATRVRVVADTELRVLSPRHLPGPVDVRVTTPGGTSDPTSRDRFTYLA